MANINRSRKSGFTLRGGRSVRESLWIGGTMIIDDLDTSGVVLSSSLSAAVLALRPFTVVRTRGSLSMLSDQFANTEDQQVAYAFCVVSDQAVAIGVTAVPTPLTDSDSDLYFVYETMMSRILVASAIGINAVAVERIIDSKAMRKVEDGQQVIAVAEAPASSEGLRLYSYNRILIKLH